MTDDPSFEVPARPERRYPATGGVEYEGEAVFELVPRAERTTDALDELVVDVLGADRFVKGDFFDLPAPAYLVRERAAGTSFRVVVRDGRVELHVLPHTEAAGLRAFYDAVTAESAVGWTVDCRTSAPGDGP